MAYEDVLYDGRLEVNRRTCTWLARRCVANWSNRGWLTFEASTDLKTMRPDLGALRDMVAKVFRKQNGFEAFDPDKFDVSWKASVGKGNQQVQAVYDAAWAGFL